MKSIKDNLGFIIVAALMFVTAFVLFNMNAKRVEGAGYQMTNIGNVATTSTRVSVTTSTRILATTTNPTDPANSYARVYATICNPNPNLVWLRLDGDKPTNINSAAAYPIGATTSAPVCYILNDDNQYLGSVTASSTNEAATAIYVTQYVVQ